jgi:hypothetical protein
MYTARHIRIFLDFAKVLFVKFQNKKRRISEATA